MRRNAILRHVNLLAALALWVAAGCQTDGGAAERRELRSRSPFERARAAVRVAEQGDAAAIHELVDLLEDDDAGVRMYTIEALRRLCGEDFGYQYQAAKPKREVAVQAWRTALRDGKVQFRRS